MLTSLEAKLERSRNCDFSAAIAVVAQAAGRHTISSRINLLCKHPSSLLSQLKLLCNGTISAFFLFSPFGVFLFLSLPRQSPRNLAIICRSHFNLQYWF